MTTLYLCEKPSQARDIGRVLGATQRSESALTGHDVIVTWCIGHLLEMAPPDRYDPALKQWSFDTLPILPEHWQMEVTKRGKKQFSAIQSCLKRASAVVIATDADREGEVIAREVLARCNWRGPVSRLWLSALDEASIRKALNVLRPGEATEPLYQAGLARARADWLVGINLTRVYTLTDRYQGGDHLRSVGRVQTPTLKLVVDRDRAIEQFKPVPYFVLIGQFSTEAGVFNATWIPDEGKGIDSEGRSLDPQFVNDLAVRLKGQQGTVDSAQTVRKQEPPPLPFSLSSLQLLASKRWGMSPQKVLDTVQALYETHKATTYPRTDCNYLPFSQHGEAGSILDALAQSDAGSQRDQHNQKGAPGHPRLAELVRQAAPTLRSRCWNDKKITAHHAIIPTATVIDLKALSDAEFKLYDCIRRHYLAQFFPPHEYDQTVIEVRIGHNRFKTTGRVPRIEGWHRVLGRPADDGNPLPAVKTGQAARLDHTEVQNKTTKPPARFTEGTLIQAMKTIGKTVTETRLKAVLKETAGIGTEATRASILETLIQRDYLSRQKKHLVSTTLGRDLIDAVPESVSDPATTAVWEQQLDIIAQGQGGLDTFVQAQSSRISELIDALRQQMPEIHADPPCPQCGKTLVIRKGRNGPFRGCSGYPACKHTQPVKGVSGKLSGRTAARTSAHTGRPTQATQTPQKHGAGKSCPDCETGQLIQRTVRNGKNAGRPFIGCTNYPECRYFAWPKSAASASETTRKAAD